MLEIEKFSCADKNEARTREQYWINYYSRKAINTPKQYYLENIDNIAEYHKKHYQKNKETILEYQKKYNSENKEKKAETENITEKIKNAY